MENEMEIHELLTVEMKKTLPALYSTEHIQEKDKKVFCKFFTPWTNWTWFILEGDAEIDENDEPTGDFLLFNYVVPPNKADREYGYVMLSDLLSVTGPFGLKIERDLHFGDVTMEQIVENATPY